MINSKVLIFLFIIIFLFPFPIKAEDVPNCNDLIKNFEKTLSEATGSCQVDTDCGCFNGISPKFVCGGVTDKTTSIKLDKIEKQFHQQKCSYKADCAAWTCIPYCLKGQCTK